MQYICTYIHHVHVHVCDCIFVHLLLGLQQFLGCYIIIHVHTSFVVYSKGQSVCNAFDVVLAQLCSQLALLVWLLARGQELFRYGSGGEGYSGVVFGRLMCLAAKDTYFYFLTLGKTVPLIAS